MSEHLEQFKKICQSKLYQFLKHEPLGRQILGHLINGDISLGKAAEAIVEGYELGVEPRLPEWHGLKEAAAQPASLQVPRVGLESVALREARAREWADKSGIAPGNAGLAYFWLYGFFNHSLSRSDPIAGTIVKVLRQYEEALVALAHPQEAKPEAQQETDKLLDRLHGDLGWRAEKAEAERAAL